MKARGSQFNCNVSQFHQPLIYLFINNCRSYVRISTNFCLLIVKIYRKVRKNISPFLLHEEIAWNETLRRCNAIKPLWLSPLQLTVCFRPIPRFLHKSQNDTNQYCHLMLHFAEVKFKLQNLRGSISIQQLSYIHFIQLDCWLLKIKII